MKLAIIGYGKMGKEIEQAARERNHTIELIVDINNLSELNDQRLKSVDVAIEFTHAEVAYSNCMACFHAGVPVVCGTTGWNNKLTELKQICLPKGYGLFHTPNFSIGMNLFFRINKLLAKLMDHQPSYNVSITEIHHTQKLDAPSGTAIRLADDILQSISRKKKWKLDEQDSADTIAIYAVREGMVPGIHTIRYESEIDFIEMTHSAKNRKGLALGAVIAAEFMKDKKGFFTMDDLLQFT